MQRDPRAFLWNVAQSSLPALLVCVTALLEELGN